MLQGRMRPGGWSESKAREQGKRAKGVNINPREIFCSFVSARYLFGPLFSDITLELRLRFGKLLYLSCSCWDVATPEQEC